MKNKRVGTISMAIVLIALGVLIFMSQINKTSTLDLAIKLWPFILILLGLEILYYRFIYKEEIVVKYDILSIFIVFTILMVNLGLFAITETGVLSKITTMALTESYNMDTNINEYTVDSNIKKIIIDQPSDKISIRSTDKRIITGSGKTSITATNKEEAMKYIDESFLNYEKIGDTIYISYLENTSYDSIKYFRLYDISLNIPNDIDVEVRNCNKIDLIYDGFENDFIIDKVDNVNIRLDNQNNIKINAYVESEDTLRGNVDWQFDKYGEYITGNGDNLIKILNSYEIIVDEI